ncbi:MAG: hypothetical protein ABIS35_02925 [Terracoccus sp.]
MPIVYIHGVAVRDEDPALADATKRFREVPWPRIQANLREHLAPVVSDDPDGVPIMRIYWGDLGAHFAWGGRSLISRPRGPQDPDDDEEVADTAEELVAARGEMGATSEQPSPAGRLEEARVRGIERLRETATALRRPLEGFLPTFIGDVMTYVARRGTAEAPGPIPLRVLAGLETAAFAAASREEPLVVITHSMGGQILYDVLTHFLPRLPRYGEIRVDFWCATASQVGFFEELGLFLESDPGHSRATGVLTPQPSSEVLGGWWNVWDHADMLSFRAEGIFAGVDDSPFFVAGSLATDHNAYLDNRDFHRMLAVRVRESLRR